jgi:hypothetical protein
MRDFELETAWHEHINTSVDGLISWRDFLALLLVDIFIEEVLERLVPVITDMEVMTTQRILGVYANSPEAFVMFCFYDWRQVWQAQFTPRHDPVRQILAGLCNPQRGRPLAKKLFAIEGQVLLDFLLAPCSDACRSLWMQGQSDAPRYPDSPVSMIDASLPGRMIEQLCLVLYDRFREAAPFETIAVPSEVSLDLNYDRLCPEEQHFIHPNIPVEAPPC